MKECPVGQQLEYHSSSGIHDIDIELKHRISDTVIIEPRVSKVKL